MDHLSMNTYIDLNEYKEWAKTKIKIGNSFFEVSLDFDGSTNCLDVCFVK